MFSKKTAMIVGVIVLIAVNIVALTVNSKHRQSPSAAGRVAISLVAPFQAAVSASIRFVQEIWRHYFFLVSAAEENDRLRKSLQLEVEGHNRCYEAELSNRRLRRLLNFRQTVPHRLLAAEVIGKDPSPWFKSITINKGSDHGVHPGLPVVIPEGIVGLVTEVTGDYAKVLLVIDQNSAVDALVQESRARGIIQGEPSGRCAFKYVLRKHDVKVGDAVISSGLDGVFPKGFRIGLVSEVFKPNSGMFQRVIVTPHVEFETLEEVMVVMAVAGTPKAAG